MRRDILVAACDIKPGDVIGGRTVLRSGPATADRWLIEWANHRCNVYYRNAKFRVLREAEDAHRR